MNFAKSASSAERILSSARLLIAYHGAAAFVCLENPIPCAACHELHCWFVNRLGSTLCYTCDTASQVRPPARSLLHRRASGFVNSSPAPRPSISDPCACDLLSPADRLPASIRAGLRGLRNRTGLSATQAGRYIFGLAIIFALALALLWMLP